MGRRRYEWLGDLELGGVIRVGTLDHCVLRLIEKSTRVGGAAWLNIAENCKVLAMVFICWIQSSDSMGMFYDVCIVHG